MSIETSKPVRMLWMRKQLGRLRVQAARFSCVQSWMFISAFALLGESFVLALTVRSGLYLPLVVAWVLPAVITVRVAHAQKLIDRNLVNLVFVIVGLAFIATSLAGVVHRFYNQDYQSADLYFVAMLLSLANLPGPIRRAKDARLERPTWAERVDSWEWLWLAKTTIESSSTAQHPTAHLMPFATEPGRVPRRAWRRLKRRRL